MKRELGLRGSKSKRTWRYGNKVSEECLRSKSAYNVCKERELCLDSDGHPNCLMTKLNVLLLSNKIIGIILENLMNPLMLLLIKRGKPSG